MQGLESCYRIPLVSLFCAFQCLMWVGQAVHVSSHW